MSVLQKIARKAKIATIVIVLIVAVVTFAASLRAVESGPCNSSEHKQFDFWLGEWDVFAANGKLAGHNSITREYGGCVIHERYTTLGNYQGESLNVYDAKRKVWHQTWVDSGGLLLLLEGGLVKGAMVLQSVSGKSGSKTANLQKITWTPNVDGSVHQHWQASDEKGDWTTVFDGVYKRRDALEAENLAPQ